MIRPRVSPRPAAATLVLALVLVPLAASPACADESLDRDVATIRRFLEEVFAPLKFKSAPRIKVVDLTEFHEIQNADLVKEAPRRRRDWKVLQPLGLVTSPEGAETRLRTLMERSVDGFYHFEHKTVYLPRVQSDTAKLLAHELTHALFDQNCVDGLALRKALQAEGGDREAVLQAISEGAAKLAEVALEAWQEDTKRRAGPYRLPPAVFDRAVARARADLEEVYAPLADDGRDRDGDTIRKFVMFSYSHGLYWVADQGRRHADDLGPWLLRLHDRKHLPRTTRAILHGTEDEAPEAPDPVRLLASMLSGAPYDVVDSGDLGELDLRAWWRLGLDEAARLDLSPLGLTAARLTVLEHRQTKALVGIAVVVFDSEAQAEAAATPLRSSGAATGDGGVQQVGRALVVPIGALPKAMRTAVVAGVVRAPLPVRRVSREEVARARLAAYLRHPGDEAVWGEFLAALAACDRTEDTPVIARLASLLFSHRVPESSEERQTEADNFAMYWAQVDPAQAELGRRAARDLPGRLAAPRRDALTRAALAQITSPDALPVPAANALRWVAACGGIPADRAVAARRTTERLFPGQPDLAAAVGRLVAGPPRTKARP